MYHYELLFHGTSGSLGILKEQARAKSTRYMIMIISIIAKAHE
jgi:hypothetical protein